MRGPSGLFTNVASMLTVRVTRQVLTLVTLPYLTRVLGAEGFGLVAIATAVAAFHQIVVEYAFDLSSSRAIARVREHGDEVRRIVANTLSAKALALLAATVVILPVGLAIPSLRDHPALFVGALAFSASQALSFGWYFQGLERLERLARIEILARIGAAASLFLFIRDAEAYWLVPWVQSVPLALGLVIMAFTAARWHGLAIAGLGRGLATLRDTWRMFAFKSSSALYKGANTILLSLVVDPATVGLFAAADKLVRSAVDLVNPVAQVMLPRQSQLVVRDRPAAERLARRTLFLLTGGAAIGAAGLVWLREPLLRLVFGAGFTDAAAVLMALALLIPFGAASNVVGVQWMVPLGMDRAFLRIVVLVGLANLVAAPIAAITAGAVGVAWTSVAGEAAVVTTMLVVLTRAGANPFRPMRGTSAA